MFTIPLTTTEYQVTMRQVIKEVRKMKGSK